MEKITIEIDKDLNAVIYTLKGEVYYTELRAAIVDYYKGKLTKYTLWDFSGSNIAKYTSVLEARELGALVNKLGKARPGGFDLLVVSDMLQYGLARMYAAYAEITNRDSAGLKAMVFREKGLALEWIRRNEITKKDR